MIGAHQRRMLVGSPLVNAEQNRSIRVALLRFLHLLNQDVVHPKYVAAGTTRGCQTLAMPLPPRQTRFIRRRSQAGRSVLGRTSCSRVLRRSSAFGVIINPASHGGPPLGLAAPFLNGRSRAGP